MNGDSVVVPPTVTKVTGVEDDKIRVRARVADGEGAVVTHDITGAFTITGGAIALNPEGEVKIGEKEIPVKPMIGGSDGEGAVVTKPFVVGEGCVSVKVATIPGLVYELKRTTAIDTAFGSISSGVKATGTGAPVTLTDDNPPADKAFYRVEVSAP